MIKDVQQQGVMMCQKPGCGYSVISCYLNTPETCSYEQVARLHTSRKFTYRKINHFREILRQAQGKMTTEVKKEVKNEIRKELCKRSMNPICLTPKMMKKILKKIRHPDLYEERVALTAEFNSVFKPIYLEPEKEEKLCYMFLCLEKAFKTIKDTVDPDRKNFMSYPATARRLCELCGWKHLLKAFPLLKEQKLRIRQDRYMEKCCLILGWTFIPTVGDVTRGLLREQMEMIEIPVYKKRKIHIILLPQKKKSQAATIYNLSNNFNHYQKKKKKKTLWN